MDTLRLWTFQTSLAWSRLQKEGVLSGDGRRAEPYFRPAYAWLREQMKTRTLGSTGRYPLWFWTHKPDLRSYRYRNYADIGETRVVIECLVPKERVLLSDYESWHSVLNDGYLALNESEYDAWHDKVGNRHISPQQAAQEKRASWERIFDFPLLAAHPEWHGTGGDVQATVEELHLHEVVSHRAHIRKR